MLKVLRNLKNSWATVLIIVILLCVQAATDLALPDYTSKIVNVGIQYGGIEDAVPEVISDDEMENLLFFTEDDDPILENYDLVEENPSSYQEKVIKKYLGKDYNVEENNLFVIKDLDEEQRSNLENLLISPLVEYSSVTNEETVSQMSDSLKEQAAISAVKTVYSNLGVDTDKLQNNYILMSGLQMLGIAFISMVSAVLIMLCSSKVAARLGRTLRDKVFKKVLSFSTAELRQFSTASLITRSTNDIQQIQQLIAISI